MQHEMQRDHPGFWGNATASVDWCEGNYVVSFYVAEFFNTLTSIPVALMGLFMLRQAMQGKRGTPLHAAAFIMMIIGMGSTLFHGTLLRGGQLLDELPMMWGACVFLAAIVVTHGKHGTGYRVTLPIAVWAVVSTVVYFLLGFDAFVVMYALTALLTVLAAYDAAMHAPDGRVIASNQQHKKFFAVCGGGVYAFAFLCLWLPEQVYCGNRLIRKDSTPEGAFIQRMHFHALFHLLSAVAPYQVLCFLLLLELDAKQACASVVWKRPAETLYLVPVPVVVHTIKE